MLCVLNYANTCTYMYLGGLASLCVLLNHVRGMHAHVFV